jgi:hypothetical protein
MWCPDLSVDVCPDSGRRRRRVGTAAPDVGLHQCDTLEDISWAVIFASHRIERNGRGSRYAPSWTGGVAEMDDGL